MRHASPSCAAFPHIIGRIIRPLAAWSCIQATMSSHQEIGGSEAVSPLWLFSVGSIGEAGSFFGPRLTRVVRPRLPRPKSLAALAGELRPRGYLSAAGVIEPGHWSRLGGLFLRLVGGTYGDHRDWPGIDAWTDSILAGLRSPETAQRPSVALDVSE